MPKTWRQQGCAEISGADKLMLVNPFLTINIANTIERVAGENAPGKRGNKLKPIISEDKRVVSLKEVLLAIQVNTSEAGIWAIRAIF